MKKILEVIILLFLIAVQSAPAAQSQTVLFSDIQPELEANAAALAGNIEQFEAIQRAMDASGKANDNYNQQKNLKFLISSKNPGKQRSFYNGCWVWIHDRALHLDYG